jgi:hypothetical protein
VTKLLRRTSSISFIWPTTFGKMHHSPPYNILYSFPRELHPNVIFPLDSQVKVPKLGFLLSQNFGHSYLSQIKVVLRVWGKYLIFLENIFLMMYNTFQSEFIRPFLSRDLWSRVKLPIWVPPILLIITYEIRSKRTMRQHFKYLCFKTFLMVSWGRNWMLLCLSNQGSEHLQL